VSGGGRRGQPRFELGERMVDDGGVASANEATKGDKPVTKEGVGGEDDFGEGAKTGVGEGK